MKVLLDHQIFSLQRWGGISRLFTELHQGLLLHDGVQVELPLLLSNNEYLKKGRRFFSTSPFRGREKIIFKINQTWSQLVRSNDYDIIQPTYYDRTIAGRYTAPVVLTVFDMIHEKFDEYMSEPVIADKKYLCQKAGHIIAISQHTKNDLIDLYDLSPEKISVVHLASSLNLEQAGAFAFPEKFVLFVGKRESYKNFSRFYSAIKPHLKADKKLHVVAIGGGSFGSAELNQFQTDQTDQQLLQFSLSDQQMISAYREALFFVFPSEYEGFGIPVLEAMGCGCVCALSNTSSLPEVGSDAAIYFDPKNVEQMQSVFADLLENSDLRDNMRQLGLRRASQFSWSKMVNQYVDVYQKLTAD